MATRLVLHVGLMKSGTSFVQHVMRKNNAELRDRGVLFPTPWKNQVRAVRDISEHPDGRPRALAGDGPWRRLMGEIDAWPGTAVVSMEFLGPRSRSTVMDIVAALPDSEIHVVVSVRDLARTIPAMWQENVQNWGRLSWEEYVAGVRTEDRSQAGPGRSFWQRQDASRIVGTWLKAVGRDHLSVLTVPQRGAPSSLLWDRFASIVGVDGGRLDLDVPSNPSLGLPSLLVLRAINARLRAAEEPISNRQYERTVKQLLAKRGLAGRAGEPRLGYDAPWVGERGELEIRRLRDLDVRVVGDLAELRCEPVPGADPASVSAEDRLEAALDALALLTESLAERRGRGRP